MLKSSRSIQNNRMRGYNSTADMPVAFSVSSLSLLAYYESTDALYTTSGRTVLATADTNDVGSMTDGEATNNLNAGTPATLKTGITPSGGRIVRFNGTDDYLESASNMGITGAAAWTVTIAFKSVSTASNGSIWSLGAYGTAYQVFGLQQGSSASQLIINSWGGSTSIADGSVNFETTFRIVTVKFDGTDLVCYVNGTQKSTDSSYSSMDLVDAKFRLGGRVGGYAGMYGNIDVQSLYIANSAMNDTNRGLLENYIADNIGITI